MVWLVVGLLAGEQAMLPGVDGVGEEWTEREWWGSNFLVSIGPFCGIT
jgi:hypothetical protein